MTATNADGTNTKTSYITVTGVGGGCVKTVVEVDNTPISSPTTWDSCHIYHITNSVGLTATLTIEAGTVVKFDALKGINVNSGQLIVNGTVDAPVIFTSAKMTATEEISMEMEMPLLLKRATGAILTSATLQTIRLIIAKYFMQAAEPPPWSVR